MRTSGAGTALERLRAVTVAKDLFTSDWYLTACAKLRFDDDVCGALAAVAEETTRERAALLQAMHEWAERSEQEEISRAASAVVHAARLDFLRTVVEAKTAAAEAIEKSAAAAPEEMRQRILELAAIDFRHATSLRKFMYREYENYLEAASETQAGHEAPHEGGR